MRKSLPPRGGRPSQFCVHMRQPVSVGNFTVLAGAYFNLESSDLEVDILVPLIDMVPFAFGRRYTVIGATLEDYGGVPDNWREFLEEVIIPELAAERRVLVFCMAGHGRTGTLLASLIALLESDEQTPDPIAAVRQRYCRFSVETLEQTEAVFALRGKELPAQYRDFQ